MELGDHVALVEHDHGLAGLGLVADAGPDLAAEFAQPGRSATTAAARALDPHDAPARRGHGGRRPDRERQRGEPGHAPRG